MVLEVLGDVLPAAAAVALSPFPVVAIVVLLSGAEARAKGVLFTSGWVLGLAALATIIEVIEIEVTDSAEPSPAVAWIRVAFGAALLVGAAFKWRSRPRGDEPPEPPGWMKSIDSVSTGRAFVLGVGLSAVNPKNFALTFSAATAIADRDPTAAEAVVATAIFVVLSSLLVLTATVAHLVAPDRSAQPLANLKAFMLDNGTAIMVVILIVFGLKIMGDGIADV